jgi:hypothetical protein
MPQFPSPSRKPKALFLGYGKKNNDGLNNENRWKRNEGEGKEGDNTFRRRFWLNRSQGSSFSVFVCGLSDFNIFFHIIS